MGGTDISVSHVSLHPTSCSEVSTIKQLLNAMPYYDDEGNEVNADLLPKPHLCIGCVKNELGDEMEQILCSLTRLDQAGEKEFTCYAYVPKRDRKPID